VVSQGLRDFFWLQGMQAGFKGAYDCVKAFSETDLTEDLEKFDVPTLILHGDDDQIMPIGAAALMSSKIVRKSVAMNDTKSVVQECFRRLGIWDADAVGALFADDVDWNVPAIRLRRDEGRSRALGRADVFVHVPGKHVERHVPAEDERIVECRAGER
jgi:hypothetical protein